MVGFSIALLTTVLAAAPAADGRTTAQPPRQADAAATTLATIEAKTAGLKKIDGFFPLYWDEAGGRLWMEIPRLETEVLYITGLGSGLGSNDIGIDRGQLAGSRIVTFQRVGPKVLMVQPNYRYRAISENPAEVRAVRDAFARSVLWGFTAAAASGPRVLVDATEFLVRDSNDLASRLSPGTYRFEPSRSSVHLPMTMGFPKNTEMEVELTFARQAGGGGGGGPRGGGGGGAAGGSFFEGVASVAASPEAASFRLHHSFVELPGPGYTPRRFDPRSGYGSFAYQNYAAPLGEPMTERLIRRHRLQKVDPAAKVSDPVEPIVYYLDPGAPEPIRTALLDGARWWNQAFEAAGYRNAFRVELLPEGVSPLDVRYNVINWVHRSTRGWSTGASVTDPRTGEIIKGVVTLGSLRIRQDYMIAEGLLSPYRTGAEKPPELAEWGLARIRQLSAHEVGHTLGLDHNYYDSDAGRISVLDYPHPLVTLKADNTLDISKVYAVGIGDWDKVTIAYGYQDFPAGTDTGKALTRLLDEAWTRDLRFMTSQDMEVNPRVDVWSNGTDPAKELTRMMDVRRAALARFGEQAIRQDQPLALLEEVLVPLYLHHRYQVDAAASAVGGLHYIYALRGDGREPMRPVPPAEQQAALDALLATLRPSELALPAALLAKLPPRPSGYGAHRELFPRNTGPMFDAITPAIVASDLVIGNLFEPRRAARLVEQHALNPAQPGLDALIARVLASTFQAPTKSPYEAEIARGVQRVVIEGLMTLAGSAAMPQVRAEATRQLTLQKASLAQATSVGANGGDEAAAAHVSLLVADIGRFLDRPFAPAPRFELPEAPPGAPIGEPAMDWLRRLAPICSVQEP